MEDPHISTYALSQHGERINRVSYLGTHSSIFLESSLVSDHLDTLHVNNLRCYTQCSPTTKNRSTLQFLVHYKYSLDAESVHDSDEYIGFVLSRS